MRDDIPIGPTGRFPGGKIRDDDEGEMGAAIGTHKGQVVIDFGGPVTWLALPPGRARDLALTILRHASRVDGRRFTVEF